MWSGKNIYWNHYLEVLRRFLRPAHRHSWNIPIFPWVQATGTVLQSNCRILLYLQYMQYCLQRVCAVACGVELTFSCISTDWAAWGIGRWTAFAQGVAAAGFQTPRALRQDPNPPLRTLSSGQVSNKTHVLCSLMNNSYNQVWIHCHQSGHVFTVEPQIYPILNYSYITTTTHARTG